MIRPIDRRNNPEFEQSLSPERGVEGRAEREPGGEKSEAQIMDARQRNAIFEIQNRDWVNCLYGDENNTSVSKDRFNIQFFGGYSEYRMSTFKIRQEYDLQVICGYTKSDFPQEKINMSVYTSLQTKIEADSDHKDNLSSFNRQEFRIYRVWEDGKVTITLPHEITKAVLHTWNTSPCYFFEEGLASAVDELAFGYKFQIGEDKKWLDDFMKDILSRNNQIPPISSLWSIKEGNQQNTLIICLIAGSFVKFLIHKYGVDKVKQLYIAISEGQATNQLRAITLQLLNEDIDKLDSSWKQFNN